MSKSTTDSEDAEMKINHIMQDYNTSFSTVSSSSSSNTNTTTTTINNNINPDVILLHRSWHVPYIAHFTWLFQKQLNIKAVSIVELESALCSSSTSTLL